MGDIKAPDLANTAWAFSEVLQADVLVFSTLAVMANNTDDFDVKNFDHTVPSVAKKIGKKLLREVFSKFFGHLGAPMRKTKNRGHRNVSVVKFSARCDAWSSKKRKKLKIAEPAKMLVKINKN